MITAELFNAARAAIGARGFDTDTQTGIALFVGAAKNMNIALLGAAESGFFNTIASIIIGFANELPPKVAIDQARRGAGSEVRPTREELEEMFKEVDAS